MKKLFTFILLPVLLTTLGEFILKFNVTGVILSLSLESVKVIMTTPMILLAILMIFGGGLLWLVALSKYELSFLYPFLSINYVAIMLGSQFFLNEMVSVSRYISVLLIIGGLIIISRSPYAESDHE